MYELHCEIRKHADVVTANLSVLVFGSDAFIFFLIFSDFHVDRAAFDDRLEDSDRDSFGFQLIDLPSEERDRQSDTATVESSMICEPDTDDEAGYFLAQFTHRGKEDPGLVSGDWHFLVSSLVSDHPSPKSDELAPEHAGETCKDVEHFTSFEPTPTSENDYTLSDIAAVPARDFRELTSAQLAGESYWSEIYKDASVSISTDTPSFAASNISPLHTAVGTSEQQPISQLKIGSESAVLSAMQEEISCSPLVTSSSLFLAAVEVCGQSSDQTPMSLSVGAPVYAHPDAVCLEPSAERPSMLERDATHHAGDVEEQCVPPFGPQFPSQSDYEEIRQPDGSIVRRRVIRTSVRRVATRRVRRRQPDGRVVEHTETIELPTDDVESGDGGQLSELTSAAAVVPDADVSGLGHVVGVHTDTAQPHVDTDVEVVRETLPDGRVIERRIVRTRQRKTLVKRVVVRPDRH